MLHAARANNDHIVFGIALQLFVAQVDPESLVVLRRTEKALLPERGVMFRNLASAITADESCD
ncbi:MAG: hypothetical protein U1D30_01090 [Planctomycetota bacterium]